jgi:hypothetical protein
MHLFLDPEFDQLVHFNYAVTVLRDNMKDYDISRAKLVSSRARHTFQFIHTHLRCTAHLQHHKLILFVDLDPNHLQRTLGRVLYQPCA